MAQINEVDRRVLGAMSGRDKIKALLSDRGFTLRAFAEKHNFWVENVSYCIGGKRDLPEVRDALAEELDVSREEIDRLIDSQVAA